MANMIEAQKIEGASVYGVTQVSYAVGGVSGHDYRSAIVAASFKHAVSIEAAASAYTVVVRQRETKVDELGQVLAILSEAVATMDPKSNNTDKESSAMAALSTARDICEKYGLTLKISNNKITYANAHKAQNDIEYALDVEDNNLQQDLVSLQSYITKRDNAYSTASKLSGKSGKATNSTIRNIM